MRAPDAGTPQREAEPTITGEMIKSNMCRGELGGSSHSERGIAVSFRTEEGTDLPLVGIYSPTSIARPGHESAKQDGECRLSGRKFPAYAHAAAGLETPSRLSTRVETATFPPGSLKALRVARWSVATSAPKLKTPRPRPCHKAV
jgi:hypothetical protein